jgi:hypothetical protein
MQKGVEPVLEPLSFPPPQTHQKARFGAGIFATAFITSDIQSEYCRLKERGGKISRRAKEHGTDHRSPIRGHMR